MSHDAVDRLFSGKGSPGYNPPAAPSELIPHGRDSAGFKKPDLRCDMEKDCRRLVSMIDNDGFAYCTDHGEMRRMHQPCRKLRPHELNRLRRGEQLKRY